MHRSGTSMLTKILNEAGLFIGNKLDRNNESVFFSSISQWFYARSGATWDNPYNTKFLLPKIDTELVLEINRYLQSFKSIRYQGIYNFYKYRNIKFLPFPYGFKNPANTFLIPVWEKIFPELKIIHIYRNPYDVAISLAKREDKRKNNSIYQGKNKNGRYNFQYYANYHQSIRVEDPLESIKLWHEYVSTAFSYDLNYKNRLLHIRYEELLLEPEKIISNAISFCNLDINNNSLKTIISQIDPSRDNKKENNFDIKILGPQINSIIDNLNY